MKSTSDIDTEVSGEAAAILYPLSLRCFMQVETLVQLQIVIQFCAPESVRESLVLIFSTISGDLTKWMFWNPKASILLSVAFSFPFPVIFSKRTATLLVLEATTDAILLFLVSVIEEARNRVAFSTFI